MANHSNFSEKALYNALPAVFDRPREVIYPLY